MFDLVALDRAVSPFPLLKVPYYEDMKFGAWELAKKADVSTARGYFSGPMSMGDNWALLKDGTVWMSTTPMELESQAHHAVAAHGNVLIAGAGMGVLAYNCAIKPEVESVTIVEIDESVIHLLDKLASSNWVFWDKKVDYLHADILGDSPHAKLVFDAKYDVVLVDIWAELGDTAVRPDMQAIACRIKADAYAGWGMELDFMSWYIDHCPKLSVDDMNPEHWMEYSRDIGVPLIQPYGDMAAMALQAAYQISVPSFFTHC